MFVLVEKLKLHHQQLEYHFNLGFLGVGGGRGMVIFEVEVLIQLLLGNKTEAENVNRHKDRL